MNRILVTGASGFLGRHLCRALIKCGDLVIGIVRDMSEPSQAGTTELLGHGGTVVFGSFEQVERAIAEYEVDVVIHLAAQAQVSVAHADPIGTLEANVRGTWQVLEACRRQKVKRVIIASSDKAYGDGPVPYSEQQPLRPHGIYATSKTCGDMLAHAYALDYGMSIAVTRCGNLYGPGHTNWSTLIPGTIRSVLRGERPRLRSNGGPRRDYLYVEDAVEGYLKLIEYIPTGPFNFGTGRSECAYDIACAILELMGSNLEVDFDVRDGAAEIDEQVLSCTRATEVLGWQPRHSLEEGLKKTIAWYREYLKEQS